eukprot:663588-Rhodomonas_salina.1
MMVATVLLPFVYIALRSIRKVPIARAVAVARLGQSERELAQDELLDSCGLVSKKSDRGAFRGASPLRLMRKSSDGGWSLHLDSPARPGHGGSCTGRQWHWHHVPPLRLSESQVLAGARRRHGHGDADIGISWRAIPTGTRRRVPGYGMYIQVIAGSEGSTPWRPQGGRRTSFANSSHLMESCDA